MVFMYRQVTHLIVFLVFNCRVITLLWLSQPSGNQRAPDTYAPRRIKILLIQKPLPNSSAGFRVFLYMHVQPLSLHKRIWLILLSSRVTFSKHPFQLPVHCHHQTEVDVLLWDSHICIHSLLHIVTIKFLYSSFHLVFEFHQDQDCFFFFFLIWLLFFSFLAALGLRCCVWAFSSYGEQQFYSFKAWASHCNGFSCGTWA